MVTAKGAAGKSSLGTGRPQSPVHESYQPSASHPEELPGSQSAMAGADSADDPLPTDEDSYKLYKAAGKLEGKKVLISGGDSGVGRAIAVLYAMEGAESTIIHLPEDEADARETERLVREQRRRVHLIQADLTDPKACRDVVDQAIEKMGRINVLVLNLGTKVMEKTIAEVTDNEWVTTFNSNIHPFFLLSKYITPQMTSGDSVITYAPAYPYIGHPDMLDYTSSRGAVISLTRNLANEHAEHGVRVNAVCPGAVRIPQARTATNSEPQANPTSLTAGRPALPSEVAACFVLLAGPGSRLISGQCWHINGGVAACFVNLAGPSSSSIPGQSWPANGEVVGG